MMAYPNRKNACVLPCILALCGSVGMAFSQWLLFAKAPLEKSMGPSQKIFYLHLPLAWWALVSFFIVFLASCSMMKKYTKNRELLADAAAEVGLVFTSLVLATGLIWSKAAWWNWWVWDPKLLTTLALWFIYAGYCLLRGLDIPERRKAKGKAAIGILGFLDVPLVFFAARLWHSHHPAGIMSSREGLAMEMRWHIFMGLLALGLFWTALLLFRYRLARLEERITLRKKEAQWKE